MVRNGLIKEEVDLLQGRIPPSILKRHYWSPFFKARALNQKNQIQNLNKDTSMSNNKISPIDAILLMVKVGV